MSKYNLKPEPHGILKKEKPNNPDNNESADLEPKRVHFVRSHTPKVQRAKAMNLDDDNSRLFSP
jgi:hypothetical protein